MYYVLQHLYDRVYKITILNQRHVGADEGYPRVGDFKTKLSTPQLFKN